MAAIDLGVVPVLAGVRVVLEGGPSMPSYVPDIAGAAWRGVAHGSEALVAVAFVTTKDGTRWVKSRRSWGNGVRIEVVQSLGLSLASWVWPEVRRGTGDELGARANGIRPADGEVQVPVVEYGWAAHAGVPYFQIDSPSSMPTRIEGEAGSLVRLWEDHRWSVALDFLFLPRRQIEARRCAIWRLKRRCRDEVPEPLRHVLCFGRAGTWPPERLKGQRYAP